MNKEQANAETIQLAVETVCRIAEAITPVFEKLKSQFAGIWEAIIKCSIPAKWWHFYKHAKKARVRKKYYHRILNLLPEVRPADR